MLVWQRRSQGRVRNEYVKAAIASAAASHGYDSLKKEQEVLMKLFSDVDSG